MSSAVPGASSGFVSRVRSAWQARYGDQRLAAIGALGLFGSMFLPWYQQTAFLARGSNIQKSQSSLIAFQSWSFVEASILLVAIAVLGLLFARAERRVFHLPGGDGFVILAAGAWVMLLVFIRQIDKPGGDQSGDLQTTVGVSWGIFVAFLFGALIAYAGWRIRVHHRPEPVRDGERPRTPAPADVTAATAVVMPPVATPQAKRGTRRPDGQFEGQLSFEDPDAPPS